MNALRKTTQTPGELTLCNIPEPEVTEDDVKLRVHASGLCGTDMHIREGGYGFRPPVTLGHEIGAEIVEVGASVGSLEPGDRVTVNPTANNACGQCRFCQEGRYFFCPERRSIGSGSDGGFAEYITVPEGLAFKLPEETSYDSAAMVEPFACCVKAVCQCSPITPGTTVLLCGPGPIGLMSAWLAQRAGARVVVAGTNADDERLAAAKGIGLSETVNVEVDDVTALIHDTTSGNGADVAIDCGGTRGSVDQCLQAVADCGHITQVALIDHPFEIDWGRVIYKELTVQGSIASDWMSWEQTMTMVRGGDVDLTQFVSHHHDLASWESAFHNAENKVGLKQIIRP